MKKKVIIIGAGFAGVQFTRHIDTTLFEVLLIDKLNHHQFQPLFYQVATSQIEPSSISFPIRYIFQHKKNIEIRLTEVTSIDAEKKLIHTPIGDFKYDILVLAMGCKTNFFGNKQIEENAFTLKSTYDAIAIRNHILNSFEALISSTEEEKSYLQNLVIVGAGPTGVELAGAFSEIKKYNLPKDYPNIDFSKFKIILVEGSQHTLNSMSIHAKQASEHYLRDMGVEMYMETFVKEYDGLILTLSNGERINTKTVIWAAGVTANVLEGLPKEVYTAGNRLMVDRSNQVIGLPGIYAIGDIASMQTPLYPKGHPQVANVAIHQASNLAGNLKAMEQGKSLQEYEYKDLGSMATVGRNKAVVDVGKLKMKGYFAWLIWMFLHLMLILSVKNKLIIFINWMWAYITKNSSLRLILTPSKHRTK
ncbi:MAG TPA: NAD(P)/FAD-dependent oxidoreductase [Chitinophagaceae bacterium]|nr:NAD(P)/FAD-dependent oxidoreductase [Chitinophagaceae bacterium]